MTLDLLSMILGVVTSLLFEYFPGLATWFNGKPANVKKLLQLAMAVVIAGCAFGLLWQHRLDRF